MFELKFIIKAKRREKRHTLLQDTEHRLREEFPDQIVDVSRWEHRIHPVDDEFLVSVNYHGRDPHTVRAYVTCDLRLRAISLTNLVTGRTYPLNRATKRKQIKSR